jgi:DNA-binding NtrC family response regulator
MLNKSIAILNHDTDLLNIFTEALKKSGYHNISSFTDPVMACQQIQENQDRYSLLIIDDKMPNVNGLFLSTKLLETNPKLNVIIMSDYYTDLKCNYKFNILKKRVSILRLIDAVNESMAKSISKDNNLYYRPQNSEKKAKSILL